MRYLLSILMLTAITCTAQPRYSFLIGSVNDSGARVVAVADTVRGAWCWKAFTVSDHDGEKDIRDGVPVLVDGRTYVYDFVKLEPKTTYECVVMYRDTVVRDTFTTSATTPQGKLPWQQMKTLSFFGKSYQQKYFREMMTVKGRREKE